MPNQAHDDAIANARATSAIATKLDIFVDEFKKEREDASTHRKDLREVVGALSEAVRTQTAAISEIRPIVAEYQNTRAEARGAAKMVKYIWTVVVMLAGLVGAWIGKKI